MLLSLGAAHPPPPPHSDPAHLSRAAVSCWRSPRARFPRRHSRVPSFFFLIFIFFQSQKMLKGSSGALELRQTQLRVPSCPPSEGISPWGSPQEVHGVGMKCWDRPLGGCCCLLELVQPRVSPCAQVLNASVLKIRLLAQSFLSMLGHATGCGDGALHKI